MSSAPLTAAHGLMPCASRLEIGFQTAAKHHANVLRKLAYKNDAALLIDITAMDLEATMKEARGLCSPA
jgi:hypothetical protein